MTTNALPILILWAGSLLTGCVTTREPGGGSFSATEAPETILWAKKLTLNRDTEERVLALNPENVTREEIRDVLSKAPAPRIINIHGGILPIQGYLISFSLFLTGMGYPEVSI